MSRGCPSAAPLRKKFGLFAAGWLALVTPAAAELGVTVKLSTLGAGVEAGYGFSPQLVGRLGVNGFDYSRRGEAAGGNRYDATARLRTATGLLDWHPGGHSFHVTGGVVYDGNKVEGDSLSPASGLYRVGDVQIPAALLGRLHGKVDFHTVAPYAGLGWGGAPRAGRGFGILFDAGVIFQGRPRAHLTPVLPAGSPLAVPPASTLLAVELAKEEQKVESRIDKYRYFPVLAVGLSYRF
ncbi:MAG TPA: hypothetical protein VHQ90_20345 [Thermoanaerobaculia bacterium]|nr:hypothetical protein [Thermoanaerobaculia bacterium]